MDERKVLTRKEKISDLQSLELRELLNLHRKLKRSANPPEEQIIALRNELIDRHSRATLNEKRRINAAIGMLQTKRYRIEK